METKLPQRLTTIFYADVAGYSRLPGEGEASTHLQLCEILDLISAKVAEYRGQVMQFKGLLSLFGWPDAEGSRLIAEHFLTEYEWR